jgi:hypothetical protein
MSPATLLIVFMGERGTHERQKIAKVLGKALWFLRSQAATTSRTCSPLLGGGKGGSLLASLRTQPPNPHSLLWV